MPTPAPIFGYHGRYLRIDLTARQSAAVPLEPGVLRQFLGGVGLGTWLLLHEPGVRYATVSHDGRHAGRGGHGAVLGSKNIKAVAVRGSQRCSWAHPSELVAASKSLSEKSFGPATAKYRELGTASNLLLFNRL